VILEASVAITDEIVDCARRLLDGFLGLMARDALYGAGAEA
jgi:hypothetical protein